MQCFKKASFVLMVALGATCVLLFVDLRSEREKSREYPSYPGQSEGKKSNAASAAQSGASGDAGIWKESKDGTSSGTEDVAGSRALSNSINKEEYSSAVQYAKRRSDAERTYGDLVRQLKLTQRQAEEFFGMLVEMREKGVKLEESAINASSAADAMAKVQNAREEFRVGIASEILSRFGEAGLAAYDDYQKTIPYRNEILVLNQQVASIGEPLNREQRDQLLAAMQEENVLMARHMPADVVGQAALDQQMKFEQRPRDAAQPREGGQ